MKTLILRVFPSLIFLALSIGPATASTEQRLSLDEVVAIPEMQRFAQEMAISTDTLKAMLPIMIAHRKAIARVEESMLDPQSGDLRRMTSAQRKQVHAINNAATRQMRPHLSKSQLVKWRKIVGISKRSGSTYVHNYSSSSGSVASGYEPAGHGLRYW